MTKNPTHPNHAGVQCSSKRSHEPRRGKLYRPSSLTRVLLYAFAVPLVGRSRVYWPAVYVLEASRSNIPLPATASPLRKIWRAVEDVASAVAWEIGALHQVWRLHRNQPPPGAYPDTLPP